MKQTLSKWSPTHTRVLLIKTMKLKNPYSRARLSRGSLNQCSPTFKRSPFRKLQTRTSWNHKRISFSNRSRACFSLLKFLQNNSSKTMEKMSLKNNRLTKRRIKNWMQRSLKLKSSLLSKINHKLSFMEKRNSHLSLIIINKILKTKKVHNFQTNKVKKINNKQIKDRVNSLLQINPMRNKINKVNWDQSLQMPKIKFNLENWRYNCHKNNKLNESLI